MKKWIVMMLVLGLAFVGCSKPADQSAPPEAEESGIVIHEVESTDVLIPEEASQPGLEDPDVKGCLQLVNEANFDDALPICLAALKKHPDNAQVKEAAGIAQAAVGEAVATATEAAEDAQEAAGQKAQDAMEEAPIGSLP